MSTKAHPDYGAAPMPEWKLRLYVTDWNPRCVAAFKNITKICEENVDSRCNIEVVDLLEKPELASEDQIITIPTLVKLEPQPRKIIIGDMSNVARVLKGLEVENLTV
jgi:circadian clock protein KaiB